MYTCTVAYTGQVPRENGNVVLDSLNMDYRDENNILDQISKSKHIYIYIISREFSMNHAVYIDTV